MTRYLLHRELVDGTERHRAQGDDGRWSRWYPSEAELVAAILRVTGWRSPSYTRCPEGDFVVERVQPPWPAHVARAASDAVRRAMDGEPYFVPTRWRRS